MRSGFSIVTIVFAFLVAAFLQVAAQSTKNDDFRRRMNPIPANTAAKQTAVPAAGSKTFQEDIRWQETFDSPDIPAGWQIINFDESDLDNGLESVWQYRQEVRFESDSNFVVIPQSGQSFWHSSFRNANEFGHIDEWIISPTLPITIEDGDSLFFWAGAIGGAFPDSLYVFATEPENVEIDSLPAGWFPLGEFRIAGSGTDSLFVVWEQYGVPLDSLVGDSVVVAINYYMADGGSGGSGSDNVWVDNITVENREPATSIGEEQEPLAIGGFYLHKNYPNPFNPLTRIEYELGEATDLTLEVFNVLGQRVKLLASGRQLAGSYSVTWDGQNNYGVSVPAGVYFYQLRTDTGFQETRKMLLIK